MTPISPSTCNVCSCPTRSSTDGPMTTPARISATTGGNPTRSAISAATLAATRTIRMSRRMLVTDTARRCYCASALGCAACIR